MADQERYPDRSRERENLRKVMEENVAGNPATFGKPECQPYSTVQFVGLCYLNEKISGTEPGYIY